MTTMKRTILTTVIVFGLPAFAMADCEPGSTAVGAADGNATETFCVPSAVAMVATEPAVGVVNPSVEEEPNPHPNTIDGQAGEESDGQGPIE